MRSTILRRGAGRAGRRRVLGGTASTDAWANRDGRGRKCIPGLVPSVRGFAATLERVGGSQAVLNTESVKAALTDLDHSLSDMEAALSLCGISQR